jgi:hypothetical protein
MKRYTMSALAVTLALLAALPASASAKAKVFGVQAITVTPAGSLNIFMTAACPATDNRFEFTVTVSQRGPHHTVNTVTTGTEQLGVCDPPQVAVYPFLQNGLCGSPVPPPEGPCLIGSGFRPGPATVTWTGTTFRDPDPSGRPPTPDSGTKRVVLRSACISASRAPGPRADRRRCR